MKKTSTYLPIVMGVCIALGIYLGVRLNFSSRPVALLKADAREQKVKQIINFIDYEYVDAVDTDSLLDLTLTDMLHNLDPHSVYIANQDVQKSEERILGNFEGIGIEFLIFRDTLIVVRTLPGGPAEKAMVQSGDRIIAVNDQNITGDDFPTEDYTDLLKGPSGTQVYINVYRPLEGATISDISLKRAPIPIPSIDASFMLNDSVGFIRIERFAMPTAEEFSSALYRLKKEGMTELVLDLRDNPGGLLSTCEAIANEFLASDQLIVYTEDRAGKKDFVYADRYGQFKEGQVSIIINENSASAAEILAGALQDNDRATVVGRRSFGKGLVQEEMKLSDGSRLRLTTSRYYTPTGRSIQKPYKKEGYNAYMKESDLRYSSGEMYSEEQVEVNKSEKFITPGGRVVYGGGGIVPDYYVPVDTSYRQMAYMYHLFGYNQLDPYIFEYVDTRRQELSKKDLIEIVEDTVFIQKLIMDFAQERNTLSTLEHMDSNHRMLLETRVKALVAKNTAGSEWFYQITFAQDPMVLKAMENLGKWPAADTTRTTPHAKDSIQITSP